MSLNDLLESREYNQNNLSYRVNDILLANNINIKYNPEKQTCKTWYGKELKIKYIAKRNLSGGFLFSKKVAIYTIGPRTNKPLSDYKITSILLHEKTHHDIAPIEIPAIAYGFYNLSKHIEDPFRVSLFGFGFIVIYHYTIRELIVEGINYIKYKLNYIMNPKKPIKNLIK